MPESKNIDKALTDHSSANPETAGVLHLFGDLEQRLLEGAGLEGAEELASGIIRAGLLVRGAAEQQAIKELPDPLPPQWVLPELHSIFREALLRDFQELPLEFAWLLRMVRWPLPANLLPEFMFQLGQKPEFAAELVPVLGPRGQALAAAWEEFALYREARWAQPLSFRNKEQRKWAFRLWRLKDPSAALRYAWSNSGSLREADREHIFETLLFKVPVEDWIALRDLGGGSQGLQQQCWVRAACLHFPEYGEEAKERFLLCAGSGDWSSFRFVADSGKRYRWKPERMVQTVPPQWFEDEPVAQAYFCWVHQRGWVREFLSSLQASGKAPVRVWYFKWLLSQGLLSGGFPTDLLTNGIPFAEITPCLEQWLDCCGEKIDLEAFLRASGHHQHFWSDGVCRRILALNESERVHRYFDLEAFWQRLPFKINPASPVVAEIPEECRMVMGHVLHFDSVIRTRRRMREILPLKN
ncbi:MAG: hypothetical protein IT266_09730 [Saprospiraceae bacterium]|nr:hypothetical protein [Saprospiraceae bacterium]